MAGGMFLKIPGVTGSATQAGHRGESQVDSLSIRNSSQEPTKELFIGKRVDTATNGLFKASMSGEVFGSIVVTMEWENSRVRFTFGFAMISTYTLEKGFEDIVFQYQTLKTENV